MGSFAFLPVGKLSQGSYPYLLPLITFCCGVIKVVCCFEREEHALAFSRGVEFLLCESCSDGLYNTAFNVSVLDSLRYRVSVTASNSLGTSGSNIGENHSKQ